MKHLPCLILLTICTLLLSTNLAFSQTLPTVETTVEVEVSYYAAFCKGEVISNGEDNLISRGIVWSSSEIPTLELNEGLTNNGQSIGEFTSYLGGLEPLTVYYFRAYATNSIGTAYGQQFSFETTELINCGVITDVRDDNIYNTIIIGSQCWMSENLKYLSQVTGPNNEWNSTDPSYSVYNYTHEDNSVENAKLTGNYENYGVLYNWYSAVDACPEGWHLPSELEWVILEEQLLNEYSIINEDITNGTGNALKSCRQQNSIHGGICSTDVHPRWNENETHSGYDFVGFSALPGGLRSSTGVFFYIGEISNYWSETDSLELAIKLSLNNDLGTVEIFHSSKNTGNSIRCVQNVSDEATAPMINTLPAFDITQSSGKTGGEIINDGGAPILEKGIVISDIPNPTLNENNLIIAIGTGSFDFITEIEELIPGSNYYIKAYAINAIDTVYGQEIELSTLEFPSCGSITDSRDGNIYQTVIIGTQCWMSENLKYLPSVTGSSTEWGSTEPQYSVYGYTEIENSVEDAKLVDNYEHYGVLYNWYAAQNACPDSWHIPSEDEYLNLVEYLNYEYGLLNTGSLEDVGTALKSCRQNNTSYGCNCNTNLKPRWSWDWDGIQHYGTNRFGFNALPGGRRVPGGFSDESKSASWWTSSERESNPDNAWVVGLRYDSGLLNISEYGGKLYGESVRCVQDYDVSITTPVTHTISVSDITTVTAKVSVSVESNGGASIITKGLVYDTVSNPTMDLNEGLTSEGFGGEDFERVLYGLSDNSTYYVRSYAENMQGIAYGEELEFTTSSFVRCGNIIDTRDSKVYSTIRIGNQCWMAENLRYLPVITGPTNEWNSSDPRYSVYGYIDAANSVIDAELLDNYESFGGLYNWRAASTACPEGWHLPSSNEWDALIDCMLVDFNIENVDVSDGAGNALKSCRSNETPLECNCLVSEYPYWYINSYYEDIFGTDILGFSALPSGYRDYNGYAFSDIANAAKYWTTDEEPGDYALAMKISNIKGDIQCESLRKANGLAIRCVIDHDPFALAPTVETISVFNETGNAANIEGDVTSHGGAVVLSKGFVYSLTTEPTLESNLGVIETGTGIGNYVGRLSGLEENTTYYVRAYATNNSGTSYGNDLVFTTIEFQNCGLINDIRDGNTYKTVKIGNQCWMAENLKYLPEVTGSSSQWDSEDPRYAVYGYTYSANDVTAAAALETYTNYGVLYNWYAALDACPQGWQLPDSLNWKMLLYEIETEYAIFNENTQTGVGAALKSCRSSSTYLQCECEVEEQPFWDNEINSWDTENDTILGTDLFGFSALPGGRRINTEWEDFYNLSKRSYFWSATQVDSLEAYTRCFYQNSGNLREFELKKDDGYSVRCVKSAEINDDLPEIITLPATDVTNYSASIGCELLTEGEFGVAYTGVVLGNTLDVSLEENFSSAYNEFNNLSTFFSLQNGLESGSTYYYRAFVITSVEVFYGEVLSFETGSFQDCGQLIDNRDDETYNTVIVGEQCWMAENLRYLPEVTGPHSELDWYTPQYCVYDYLSEDNFVEDAKLTTSYQLYGVLYNWYGITFDGDQSSESDPFKQGICPTGWHIPNLNEWKDLEMNLGMSEQEIELYPNRGTNEGSKLAGNYSLWNSGELIDNEVFGSSGFNALPSGYRHSIYNFNDEGTATMFWSSDYIDSWNIGFRAVYDTSTNLKITTSMPSDYYVPLRCVKNNSNLSQLPQVTTSDVASYDTFSTEIGGVVLSDGGSEVTERGVVWSTSSNPTVDVNVGFTNDGQWTGEFTSTILGLIQGTTYYIRAYAINSVGIAYGNEVELYTDYCSEMTVNIVSASPQIGTDGFIDVCWDESLNQSMDVSLTAEGDYSEAGYVLNDENVVFKWNFNDGTPIVVGLGLSTITHNFAEHIGYNIILVIEDLEGCVNTNLINQKVRVSIDPVWSEEDTYLSDLEINLGEEVEMCVDYTTQAWETGIPYQNFENPDTLPINDYTTVTPYVPTISSVEVNNFYDNQFVTSGSNINQICLNLVHSFIGDLTMFLECPNGQTIQLEEQGGGGCNLGIPPDNGYWYCFTNEALVEMDDAASGNSTLFSGDYSPNQSFDGLIGCPLNGTWSVIIYDNWSADVGKINGWSIDFEGEVFPEVWGYSNTYDIHQWSGNYGSIIEDPIDENCIFGTYLTTDNPSEDTEQQFVFTLTNDFGCTYDTTLNITVLGINEDDLPTVETNTVIQTTNSSTIAIGEVVDEGGSQIIEKGFVWGLETDPTLFNTILISYEGSGSGVFESEINNLLAWETYYFRAYATNSTGTSYGNTMELDIVSGDFDDNQMSSNFRLFPNPAKKTVKVLNVPSNSTFEIYDVVGKLVKSENISGETDIDISNLENGTYLFVLSSENFGIQVQKLVKQ